jgi:excisionase family DNA binding protein
MNRAIPTVTQEKFAQELGLSLSVVRAWVARGYVPTVKIGRRRLIDLDRYREQVRVEVA